MKRILPWLLLPYMAAWAQADNHNSVSLENMLNQVSEEAAQTTLESIETPQQPTVTEEPSAVQSESVDVDQLTQSIAGRLSELLGTDTKTDPTQLSISLESVVSNALQDGKQMDEIRNAVAQAMQEVTGQALELSPDVAKIEAEMANQKATARMPETKTAVITTPSSAQADASRPVPAATISQPAQAATTTTQVPEASDTTAQSTPTESGSESLPETTTVLAGESLFRVAQRVYGEANGRRFLDIYEANKDVIADINVVFEGQVLKVPK